MRAAGWKCTTDKEPLFFRIRCDSRNTCALSSKVGITERKTIWPKDESLKGNSCASAATRPTRSGEPRSCARWIMAIEKSNPINFLCCKNGKRIPVPHPTSRIRSEAAVCFRMRSERFHRINSSFLLNCGDQCSAVESKNSIFADRNETLSDHTFSSGSRKLPIKK